MADGLVARVLTAVKRTKHLGMKDLRSWGTWVAGSVKHLTPGFGSGYYFAVMRSTLVLGSVLSTESA